MSSDNEANLGFEANLVRRVHNLALGHRTPSNSLVPIYEAAFNSIHAVQDLFGADWVQSARIEVELFNENGDFSVRVQDNGIGLNEENFRSFRTYDSDLKTKRGGKGVGRLSWLKVFEHASVVSHYRKGASSFRRSFELHLDNTSPIRKHEEVEVDDKNPGTIITLHKMRSAYLAHMPTYLETVLKKLVGQFLPFLLSPAKPSITITSAGRSINLTEFLQEKEIQLGSVEIPIGDGEFVTLSHNLIEQGIVEGKANHKLYFSAHDRIVHEQDIGVALGLSTYVTRDWRQYVYAGVVSGHILNENVNAERTSFDIDSDKMVELNKSSIAAVANALSSDIGKVVDKQAELTRSVVRRYPRFSYIVQDAQKFAEDKLPRNFRTAEQVYQQLAIIDFREHREIQRRVERMSREGGDLSDPVQEGVDEILARLTDQEFSVLADYTARRKVILDLLEARLGYRPDGSMRHHAESALHEFIVPMRVDSHDVKVDQHNLWIVDDKLTYYEFWASDKALKKTVHESESLERPDVVLFSGRTAFHRPGTDQPVVIIEFKRPARDDYTDEENPFTQIYSYIEELRDGKVRDKDGGTIQEVTENTPFFCYIVADITPKLKSWMKMARISVPLAGGGGYYGYNDDYKAFVQVLSYRYLVKDARLRNEAFFKHLSI